MPFPGDVDNNLNLGGAGAALSQAQPARTQDTTFMPAGAAAGRPVMITFSGQLDTTNAGDRINVEVLCDKASPPTTVVGRIQLGPQIGANGGRVTATVTFLCPPFCNVRYNRTNVIGAGALSQILSTEVTL